ncbi:hypothetical protein BU17DRAFT_61780 [Hysterangium stoloniferum]|nr:hypothetical protein BU17DRAFT_61780 [Hysterangium stoloniferum]
MSTSNEIAPSGHDVLSLLQEVDWLQPLVSPAVLRMERQEIDDTGKREISRMKLRKRCSGLEHGHCLCYQAHDDDQHIELSEEDVEVSVEEWWQGERNFHEPPNNIQIRGSFTNATSKLNPYRRRAIDWGVGSSADSSSSSLYISPGYYCGVGLETVGRTVLHNATTAALMAKLMVYKRMVQGHDNTQASRSEKNRNSNSRDHRLNEVGILQRQSLNTLKILTIIDPLTRVEFKNRQGCSYSISGIQMLYSGGAEDTLPIFWHRWVRHSTGVPALDGTIEISHQLELRHHFTMLS